MRQYKVAHTESCSTSCNLCGEKDVSVLSNISRSGGALRTVICKSCGLVWSDPLPHNPRDFYTDDYRISYKNTQSPKPKHILRAGHVAISRYNKIKSLLPKSLSILDVGSGGGEFSYLLKTLGHDVTGVEPNKGYAEYSISNYGLNVQVGFVQDTMLAEGSFDLITIWHVLEHTENPSEVLTKLNSLLKPQGVLVVEVPNVEATCQSPKSTFHEAHIFNFNIATLQKLLVKTDFQEMSHVVSDDGGNITMIAQKNSVRSLKQVELAISGNSERIVQVVNMHTALGYIVSVRSYKRLVNRISKALMEKLSVVNFKGGKALLDKLYLQVSNLKSYFIYLGFMGQEIGSEFCESVLLFY